MYTLSRQLMVITLDKDEESTTQASWIVLGLIVYSVHYFWMGQTARAVEESGMKSLLAWCHFGIGTQHELGGKTFEDTVAFGEAPDQS